MGESRGPEGNAPSSEGRGDDLFGVGRARDAFWSSLGSVLGWSRFNALGAVLGRGASAGSPPGSWQASPGLFGGRSVGSEVLSAQMRAVMPSPVLPSIVSDDVWRRVTGWDALSAGLRSLIPVNLRGLVMEEVARLVDISTEQRMAVLWVPPIEVLRLLLDADDAVTRAAVLEKHVPVIVDACRVVLEETTHPRLAELVEFATDAVAAHEAGRTRAAQALATNVLDTVLTQFNSSRKAGVLVQQVKARHREPLSPEASLRAVRFRLAFAGVPSTYEHYRFEDRDPAFSRHGTAHAVNSALYTPANSMRALALASSLLRFLDEGQREAEHRAGRNAYPPSSAI